MNRKLVILAAALAAFVFTAQSADARNRKPIDPTIEATNFWVGAASGAALPGMRSSNPVAPSTVGTTIRLRGTAPRWLPRSRSSGR